MIWLFAVNPVTTNIIKRNPGRKGIVYAILALAVFASFTTYTGYLSEKEESYYSLLEVPVSTPQAELKRAYRKVSLKYHPDKQMDMDDATKEAAALRFAKIQEANDALQDSRAREVYNRFGPKAAKQSQTSGGDTRSDYETTALVGLSINFVIWGMMTFLMTLGDGGSSARMYSFTGLVVITLLGWQLMLSDFDFLTDYAWYWTPYDKAQIIQQLYPAWMRGSTIIAQTQFVDKEKIMNEKIQWMIVALQKIHEKVDALEGRKSKVSRTAAAASSPTRAAAATSSSESSSSSSSSSSTTGAVDPVKRAQLKAQALATKKAGNGGGNKGNGKVGVADGPQTTKPRTLGIPSWAWGIGIYVFIQWVFSS